MERAMSTCDEIGFGTFRGRRLTGEQWDHFKACARGARAQALRDMIGGVASSLRDALPSEAGPVRALASRAEAALHRWWRAYVERRRRRAAIRELRALDDRILKDIGLGRSEIESVIHDPQRLLARKRAVARSCQCAAHAGTSAAPSAASKRMTPRLIDRSAA
jgi:uncharacterized protein YjiS (DUF1127 family)